MRTSDLATKDYSNKQEELIAKYLGWTRVSASGARDCHPGDIKSEEWLGECKTHTKPIKEIRFLYSQWSKICEEAMTQRRFPVLFVDNGTQVIPGTWCMVREFQVPHPPVEYINTDRSTLVLKADDFMRYQALGAGCLGYNFHNEKVVVMPISEFKKQI